MSAQSPITLGKLSVLSQSGGMLQKSEVKILPPTPFTQPNGNGKLRSLDSVEVFREKAREIGAQFRTAMSAI